MTDGNDKLAKRYRDLAREEPGAALDAAILAASRRPVARQSFASRWGAPVSIAAVLVLAFGLTLEMRQEEPGVETSAPVQRREAAPSPERYAPAKPETRVAPQALPEPPPPPKAAAKGSLAPAAKPVAPTSPRLAPQAFPAQPVAPSPAAAESEQKVRKEAAPTAGAPLREEKAAPAADMQRAAPTMAPAVTAPPPAPPPAPAAAGASMAPQSTLNVTPAARMKSQAAPAALSAIDTELERIAALRARGRDAEADAALDQFRRDHPGYAIPAAMWERVKPR